MARPDYLNQLDHAPRLLMTIGLRPRQGDRFQPTGFPSLGPALYQTPQGQKLLVESAQSMANRLETTCWDYDKNDPVQELQGISHVKVVRKKEFLTDTILEAHRLNSPYILESSDKTFFNQLKTELGALEQGPINRKLLAEVLLRYDVGSLIHGVFLAKKELAGGRLRVARALSAFIEATGVMTAASGGVKNDHVNPAGDTAKGFGNVPFARDEFVAEKMDCYFNLDLNQIRGYGLGEKVQDLLILLSLYKIRKLLDGDLRLRTACDLVVTGSNEAIKADLPATFVLPELETLKADVSDAIRRCSGLMKVEQVDYEDAIARAKKSKEQDQTTASTEEDQTES